MTRRRYKREEVDSSTPIEGWGALIEERSLFNIGFFFGMGFAVANILVWGGLIFAALSLV